MRSVELLDIDNPDHAGFVYDLGEACADQILDDYNNDLILMMNQMQRGLKDGTTKGFLCSVNDKPCGIIWVDLYIREIGEIHAALLPEFRDGLGRHALYFMKQFIAFCFNTLHLRKLRAMIPVYLPRPERLLRHYGFKKAGLHQEEVVKNGKPERVVELYCTKTLFEGNAHGK